MAFSFRSLTVPPADIKEPAYWFIIKRFQLLVKYSDKQTSIPLANQPEELGISTTSKQYLGELQLPSGLIHCYSAEAEADSGATDGYSFSSLRKLFNNLDDAMLGLAGRAVQIVEWERTHQYCGRCSVPVENVGHERAKKCPQCGLTTYPRISPAIIVRVVRQHNGDQEILLARNVRNPRGFYSVLAGFVEPGESLEECVRREIMEEVGLKVQNIIYFGSQPWPFPHSLMIAFTAEYAGGEIVLEEEELADAGWYNAKNLPSIPPSISIARQMIDDYIHENIKIELNTP